MIDRNVTDNKNTPEGCSVERTTEDDRARAALGPQGVPGKSDTHASPTPQDKEQMAKSGKFDGHTA